MSAGEHLQDGESAPTASWKQHFRSAFSGFGSSQHVSDFWLPAIIGYAELFVYPVLIVTNQLVVVGGWLAIKTAGQWKGWEKTRTAFNRFLLGNLLAIAAAHLLTRYVLV